MITDINNDSGLSETVEEAVMHRGEDVFEYALCRDRFRERDSYTIRAVMYKRGIKVSQATACDVSSVYGAAKNMFDTVKNGCVEPYLLCDVIYDLLP